MNSAGEKGSASEHAQAFGPSAKDLNISYHWWLRMTQVGTPRSDPPTTTGEPGTVMPKRRWHRQQWQCFHSTHGGTLCRVEVRIRRCGGRCRTRTDDLLVVSQLLYQLSKTPAHGRDTTGATVVPATYRPNDPVDSERDQPHRSAAPLMALSLLQLWPSWPAARAWRPPPEHGGRHGPA